MPELDLLWLLSACVGGLIVLLLLLLVAQRLFGPLRDSSREARRLRLVGLLTRRAWTPAEQARVEAAPAALLADVCVELLQMVRGDDKQRIVEAGRRAGVVATLVERLDSWSQGVRLGAAEALGDFIDAAVEARLSAALDDPTPTVRLAAAISLANAGRAPPLRSLVDKLGLGTAECSRFIVRLFRERAAAAPAEVRALIADGEVPQAAKTYAAQALADAGAYDAVPLIAAQVLDIDADPALVPTYVEVLGDFAHPDGGAAVSKALRSSDWRARAAAAEAAGKIRLSSRADRLAELLEDRHWLVRLRSSEALGRLGATGLAALARVARTSGGPAREAARIELSRRS